jgi:dipeptidyl aminopeptidase/acylaminoacyl peptidase
MSALTLLLSAALAAAPERGPFTIEELLKIERVSAPATSPDGSQVAFVVARASPDGKKMLSALWVSRTSTSTGNPRGVKALAKGAPPREARQLTFGANERVSSPRFSPDGRRLAFVSNREGADQAFVLDLAGGDARRATSLSTGVNELLWTPDGTALLVTSDVDPKCGADDACNAKAEEAAEGAPKQSDRLLYRHWNAWRDRVRSHVLRVPLDGGEVVDLTPGDRDVPPVQRGDAGDLAVSADGKTVYFVAVTDRVEATSTNGDVYAVPVTGGAARQITSGKGWDGKPRPSPDGKRLAWLSQPRAGYESDRYHVMVANADGSGARDLTPKTELSADDLFWAANGEVLRFTALEKGRHGLYEVEVATGKLRAIATDRNVVTLAPSKDGSVVAATVDSLTAPPEIAVLGRVDVKEPRVGFVPLTAFGAKVMSKVAVGTPRHVEAKGKDGATIHGWIVTPPGHREGERHPTVVLVHGGPQGAWNDAWTFRWNAMIYAARGWTVVMPNPRGSSGYGQDYQDAVRDNWGGTPYDDVMAFTDAAIAAGAADGERMCAAGASYGGYLIYWMNGQTDRFDCFVSHAGNFHMEMAYYDTEELWFPEWEHLGTPWERPDAYARWSPHRFVQNWKTPTLVTHGELDYRVNVAQGLSAYTALQRRGIPSKLLVFPDEGHWIAKPKNASVFHDVVLAWLAEHLDRESGRAARAR